MTRKYRVDDQVTPTIRVLLGEFARPGKPGLANPGLEQILFDLGEKIVIAVMSGLLSKVLLEK